MPKAKKSRLKLGKRCRFYKRHPWAIGHGWFNTEDEVFNKVNYSASIKKPYQPKSPGCGIKTLPVRFESARRNESKLLPTYRLGLDMDDIQ